jgi:hypothetical protein
MHKTEFRGETTYAIAANDLREIALICRDEVSFDYLIDITTSTISAKSRGRYRFRHLADRQLA